jgi:uncharacterized membrane protein YhaH (DUF805 family)
MNYFLDAFKKYAQFSGRARRKEYWMFFLFYMIIYLILYIAGIAFAAAGAGTNTGGLAAVGIIFITLTVIFALGSLVPCLALVVRRLHDTGHSGGWIFISLVPLVGGIILLVYLVTDSQSGDNAYGPNPKQGA